MGGEIITAVAGAGGRESQRLIRDVFFKAFVNALSSSGAASTPALLRGADGGIIRIGDEQLVFTTDSFVVTPRTFPGGNIGSLAVFGAVNDLAMCGARPLFLSAAFILEEGIAREEVRRIAEAMGEVARCAGVEIVTGDTKVVQRGCGDGVFITTAGIGRVVHGEALAPQRIQAGDVVIVSGDVGRHGVTVLNERLKLGLCGGLRSDCEDLWPAVCALLDAGIDVHCCRDLTRGGLQTALVELAECRGVGIKLEEEAIPVAPSVRAACELIGVEPLTVACEGRFVAFLPAAESGAALEILSRFHRDAARIGVVSTASTGGVTLETITGINRPLDMASGEALPRIC